ncbi:NAD(P)/FAD-dependent oxidoreductase [Sphingomonas sp.]|uniref:NAD(P)/FAD-dependent oxidoreductase n=1 Tax=Sphingomonas sp. TaxID=28214 RepID=UPI003B0003B3
MPVTYYAATSQTTVAAAPLDGSTKADFCIVGGGYTGLSAALHAARRGLRVVLIDRGPLADGASGRNGGQAHIGMRREQPWLEAHLGVSKAQELWRLAWSAREALLTLIAEERIACDWRPGLLHLDHKPRYVAESRATVGMMRERYGHDALRFVDREEARAMVDSPDYHGGIFDASGGHLHPLDLALGIARAAQAAGAVLHPHTAATRIERTAGAFRVHTPQGEIAAERVLLACNGYLGDLNSSVSAHVAPLNNYIAVTEPLGAAAAALIRDPVAVSDSRAVVYYFRRTTDDRLLFGGGEGFAQSYPSDVAAVVRPHLLRVFPQLRDVRLDYAWGGTLAITANRLPFVRAVEPGMYAIAGYCGMGVVLGPYFGQLIAAAMTGSPVDFDRLADLPVPMFPGGRRLRRPLLVAALTMLAIKDRL